ncbi:hypothetical protein [Tenacibaculum sp. M341]|uniref:hypothetical protein n=1 Tax=Tenacibaculum sp. M341 TaxID=2530339 RepID=UPI001052FACF|nr:hypothetical protein [Tenacibaculum sp. M341]TCI93797.1 hypothetical protein EYW44_05110 [Tenacibaculum sp. M341]
MYIVKGKIREYVHFGNQKLLRKGSPHFLPNTEIVLSHFYNSQYRFHHKLWVRGIHRSGLLKKKPIYFKFLTDLRLEEVKNPSSKTMKFIKNNQILTTGNGNSGYHLNEVKEMIDFFKEYEEPEVKAGQITDNLFIKSKDFVSEIQTLLVQKNYEELLNKYLKFPIEIKKRKEFKTSIINKNQFVKNYKLEFIERVGKTILETDLETIFPSTDRMIIGLAEIEIKGEYEFKISKIEIE